MIRHAVVLAVAVAASLASVKGLVSYAGAQAAAQPSVAQTAVAQTGVAQTAVASTQAASTSSAGDAPKAAEISKRADGHYWAEVDVDGRWIHCLVDTGATAVALTQTDAARLGLDPASLRYDVPVGTANGATRAAQVDLPTVSVAGARVDHVAALVVRDGLSSSLLGMTYLGRLSRFEATPTTLILRP